jgi:putative flippase GtrA
MKFGVVGVIGTLIHSGTIIFMVEILNEKPIISSVVGFLFSFIVSFYLNSKWTFASRSNLRTLFRYLGVSLAGLFLNIMIMYFFNSLLEIWYIYAQIIVIVVVPIHNYILSKFWAFKPSS